MISIIMPVKNADRFLDECLRSIQEQTYSNWELIAINDHSTDQSLELLQQCAAQDLRIKVEENKGSGIIAALNTAVGLCSGAFIARMDADDKMLPDKLLKMKTALVESGKAHIVTAKVKYFSEGEVGPGYRQYESWLNRLVDEQAHWKEIFKECVIASPNWMMYKEDFDEVGGFQGVDYPEDYAFVFRLWHKQFKVIGIPEVLLLWREHPLRTSRNDHRFSDLWFSKMKVKYFLKQRYDHRPLLIWGAGNRAKDLVREFEARGVSINWLTANPNKKRKRIGQHHLLAFQEFSDWEKYQHIISFANVKEQAATRTLLQQHNLRELRDYFFFA